MPFITILDANNKKHQVNSNNLIFRKAIYGLYIQNNKLLIVKDKISGRWEFPGGGIKYNESPLKALKREFFEETGLKILDKKLSFNNLVYSCSELFFDASSNEAWKTKRDFFLISKTSGLLTTKGNNKDIKQACFFPLKNLPFSEVSQTIKKVFDQLLSLYKKGIFNLIII